MTVEVVIDPQALTGLTETQRKALARDALEALTSSNVTAAPNVTASPPRFFVKDLPALTDTLVKEMSSLCSVANVCALGYRCRTGPPPACTHLCEDLDCGEHGTCTVVVMTNGTVTSSCMCDSDYDNVYSGPRCEDSEMGKAKVAAIVGGVLGAFCALLLLILLIIWCRNKVSSDRKYDVTYGYSNDGYATDVAMEKL